MATREEDGKGDANRGAQTARNEEGSREMREKEEEAIPTNLEGGWVSTKSDRVYVYWFGFSIPNSETGIGDYRCRFRGYNI
jgi:hypothetical protein